MNRVFVHGLGAVSPAGWGVASLCAALNEGRPLPTQPMSRPGWSEPFIVRNVPPPVVRPNFFAHPRLRRAGGITQHTVAAALEALGEDAGLVQSGGRRLGIISCMMAGGVSYSRRFYEGSIARPRDGQSTRFS